MITAYYDNGDTREHPAAALDLLKLDKHVITAIDEHGEILITWAIE